MSSYTLFPSTKFRKDLKKYAKNPRILEKISEILEILEKSGTEGIPQNKKPHQLIGNYADYWECHIRPDLLIIWKQEGCDIYLSRLGSHSELFS